LTSIAVVSLIPSDFALVSKGRGRNKTRKGPLLVTPTRGIALALFLFFQRYLYLFFESFSSFLLFSKIAVALLILYILLTPINVPLHGPI
jgi:Ca2+/Na+ antiporter